MSDHKTLSADWVSVAIFLGGTLVLVLMAAALWWGTEGAEGSGALARAIGGAVGVVPALCAGAGLAFLGGRSFLRGARGSLLRDSAGVLGASAGLAVLLGALGDGAGGKLGALTGGELAARAHPLLGALLGAGIVFAVLRMAWLAPAARTPVADAARRPTSAPPRSEEGVTPAESAMLFPSRDDRGREDHGRDEREHEVPPSPYPENVRARGEIPSGARPLPAQAENAVYRWTAPRPAAATEPRPPTVSAPTPAASAAAEIARAATPIARAPQARAQAPEARAMQIEELADAVDEEERPLPLRPSWETTGLSDEDEPVDAYGTPLSLVEQVRRERVEDGAPIPREIDADEDAHDDVLEEVLDDGIDEADETQEPDEERIFVAAPAAPAAAEIVDEDETDDDEADDEDGQASDETEADEDLAEYEILPAFAGTPAPAPVADADDADDEAPSESDAPAVRSMRARLASKSSPSQAAPAPGLYDALPTSTSTAAPAATREPVREPVREVVLQPTAPVPPERAKKQLPADIDPRHKLLAEVGCMFLERGRVAVSMLQKQYDMDFDEACRMLDDLQEMGLIGPYLGGQSRDILLSREQWLERVGSA